MVIWGKLVRCQGEFDMNIELNLSTSSHTATESNELSPRQKIKKMGLSAYVYRRFEETLQGDPREVGALPQVAKGLTKIVAYEGPMIAKTVCDRYLRAVGIGRMGREVEEAMRRVLKYLIDSQTLDTLQELPDTDLFKQTLRIHSSPLLVLRTAQKAEDAKRAIDEIPPGEIQLVARYLSMKEGMSYRSDDLLRKTLEFFDLIRLTPHTKQMVLQALEHDLPHVDEALHALSHQR
jgi:hypothetical protein